MPAYVPKQGDIIALSFDPQAGHEQKGRRPALVVSRDLFNQKTGLAIVCPITKTEKEFPFHVPIPKGRRAKLIEHADEDLLFDVLSILEACIYPPELKNMSS